MRNPCLQSLHPAADYHAAARAVGGCPIYVRYEMEANLCSLKKLGVKGEMKASMNHRANTLVSSSDKPGNHNFELLKKLVLPDGSVLRARLPGRPTRDCLFNDPARDGERCALSVLNLTYDQDFPHISDLCV